MSSKSLRFFFISLNDMNNFLLISVHKSVSFQLNTNDLFFLPLKVTKQTSDVRNVHRKKIILSFTHLNHITIHIQRKLSLKRNYCLQILIHCLGKHLVVNTHIRFKSLFEFYFYWNSQILQILWVYLCKFCLSNYNERKHFNELAVIKSFSYLS